MDLPYLTADLPGIGGILRASDDDFFVDEEPAYAPSGAGDHVLARIEKRGLATPQAIERLARALGVAPRDVGVAGMKDRHAVTRQWISLPPPVTPEQVREVTVEGVSVLEAARHAHKLRTGHLRANRFRLRVRGVTREAAARATAIFARLAVPPGAPNWYGEQRFGRDGDNAARGRAIVLGEERAPRDRRLARLLVSALQSELFNAWLTTRLADGLYAKVVAGDLLHKKPAGQFVCDDPATDDARLAAGELAITGPMFGARMRQPPAGSLAASREDAILAAAGLPRDAFAHVAAIAEGTRRDASIEVGDPRIEPLGDDAIEVCFTLPSGAYATTVMRELMKTS
ncbi:MAG: tRNA pseudouridine(13) synthase TruD [Acidobacteriota bacterium]